jgi:hypothetical protein
MAAQAALRQSAGLGRVLCLAWLTMGAVLAGRAAIAASPTVSAPYVVEWVYRVKLGHEAEFWRLFQRTQIPVLEQERRDGSVLEYHVFKPGLHASGAARWSYRVVISYKDATSPARASVIERTLFPDRLAYEQLESQRWDFVEDHHDLPIHEVDAAAAP